MLRVKTVCGTVSRHKKDYSHLPDNEHYTDTFATRLQLLFANANLRSHISDQTPAVSACQRCRQVPRWLVTIPYRLAMPPRSSLLLKPPCRNLRLTWVLPSILLVLSGRICYRFVRRTKSPSSLLDPAESAQILIRNRCRAAVFTLFDPSPTSW